MTVLDELKCLIGAYFGVRLMDEYDLKEYVLSDIEKQIRNFIKQNYIEDFDYEKFVSKIEDEVTIRTKLQDALLFLSSSGNPIDLIIMINQRLKKETL